MQPVMKALHCDRSLLLPLEEESPLRRIPVSVFSAGAIRRQSSDLGAAAPVRPTECNLARDVAHSGHIDEWHLDLGKNVTMANLGSYPACPPSSTK
jgi:hypothetical protein